MKKAAVAIFAILLVGPTLNQLLAFGITRPVRRFSKAAEMISQQNWILRIP